MTFLTQKLNDEREKIHSEIFVNWDITQWSMIVEFHTQRDMNIKRIERKKSSPRWEIITFSFAVWKEMGNSLKILSAD